MRFILLESVDPDKRNHLRGGTVGEGQVIRSQLMAGLPLRRKGLAASHAATPGRLEKTP